MIFHGDCETLLDKAIANKYRVKCIIADPPDNLGLGYDEFNDNRPDYHVWLCRLILKSTSVADHTWFSYFNTHDLVVSSFVHGIVQQFGLKWKKYLWRYTFGQHKESDCGSGFRYILRLSRPDAKLDTSGIRVPSDRQKLYDDPRANPAGKIPDDVWEFPRVVGNSHERRSWHPTQHPEGVYSRILRMSSAGSAIDLFGGTGTLLRCARQLPKVKPLICEISAGYTAKIYEEHKCTFSAFPEFILEEFSRACSGQS